MTTGRLSRSIIVLHRATLLCAATAIIACTGIVTARDEGDYIPLVAFESNRTSIRSDEPLRIEIQLRPPEKTTDQPLYFGRTGMFGWGELSRLRVRDSRGYSPPNRGWARGDLDDYRIDAYGDVTTRFDLSEAGTYKLTVRIRDGADKPPALSKPLTFQIEYPTEADTDASKAIAQLPQPPVKSQRMMLKRTRNTGVEASLEVALVEKRTSFRVGEIVRCRCELQNVSEREIWAADPCPPLGGLMLNTRLLTAEREDLQYMNDWGRIEAERQDWYPKALKLAPGEVLRTEFCLNDFYDLTVAGEYFLVGDSQRPVIFQIVEP